MKESASSSSDGLASGLTGDRASSSWYSVRRVITPRAEGARRLTSRERATLRGRYGGGGSFSSSPLTNGFAAGGASFIDTMSDVSMPVFHAPAGVMGPSIAGWGTCGGLGIAGRVDEEVGARE